jgi:hypothetical protein
MKAALARHEKVAHMRASLAQHEKVARMRDSLARLEAEEQEAREQAAAEEQAEAERAAEQAAEAEAEERRARAQAEHETLSKEEQMRANLARLDKESLMRASLARLEADARVRAEADAAEHERRVRAGLATVHASICPHGVAVAQCGLCAPLACRDCGRLSAMCTGCGTTPVCAVCSAPRAGQGQTFSSSLCTNCAGSGSQRDAPSSTSSPSSPLAASGAAGAGAGAAASHARREDKIRHMRDSLARLARERVAADTRAAYEREEQLRRDLAKVDAARREYSDPRLAEKHFALTRELEAAELERRLKVADQRRAEAPGFAIDEQERERRLQESIRRFEAAARGEDPDAPAAVPAAAVPGSSSLGGAHSSSASASASASASSGSPSAAAAASPPAEQRRAPASGYQQVSFEDEQDDFGKDDSEMDGAMPPAVRLARALYTSKPDADDELPLRRGEIVLALYEGDGGWWMCEHKRSKGWAPGNYLEFLSKEKKVVLAPADDDPVQGADEDGPRPQTATRGQI